MIIAFTNPPILPVMDPNYFDIQRSLTDPYYQACNYGSMMSGGTAVDPQIAAFLLAENLTVYSDWSALKGIAVMLPLGQTVLDAVANWPTEYPALIAEVDPDAVLQGCNDPVFPEIKPNDERAKNEWVLRANHNSPYLPESEFPVANYSADVIPVWHDYNNLGQGVVIALLDSGVDYSSNDLIATSHPFGFNTFSYREETLFRFRSAGGGEPWADQMDKSQADASALGHGTNVAGVVCGVANNDGTGIHDDRDIIGVAPGATYLPFAIEAWGSGNEQEGYEVNFAMSAELNALYALGGVKGIIPDAMIPAPDDT